MRFTFQVWWQQDGRSFAESHGEDTLGDTQRLWSRWRDALAGWPDAVTSSGLSPIRCPKGGPWPRPGEAGRHGVVVRGPERDPDEVRGALAGGRRAA